MFQLMDFAFQSNDTNKQRRDSELYFVTDEERENFRVAFVKWVSKLKLKNKTTIVINDLNLLDDEKSKYLSWLPAVTQSNLNIICTTNDYEMVQTAEVLGWNVKEMPLFKTDGAQKLINEHLHSYGKNLSEEQFEKEKNTSIYWDDVALFCYPEEYRLGIREMNADDVIEIDSLYELAEVDSSYKKFLNGGQNNE
jgi:CTP:phosphocholine cytidylyltransferase-like protein